MQGLRNISLGVGCVSAAILAGCASTVMSASQDKQMPVPQTAELSVLVETRQNFADLLRGVEPRMTVDDAGRLLKVAFDPKGEGQDPISRGTVTNYSQVVTGSGVSYGLQFSQYTSSGQTWFVLRAEFGDMLGKAENTCLSMTDIRTALNTAGWEAPQLVVDPTTHGFISHKPGLTLRVTAPVGSGQFGLPDNKPELRSRFMDQGCVQRFELSSDQIPA